MDNPIYMTTNLLSHMTSPSSLNLDQMTNEQLVLILYTNEIISYQMNWSIDSTK